MPFDFRTVFHRALPYAAFLDNYATPDHKARWDRMYQAVALGESQRALLASFRRRMNVLCLSGPWCGDCINVCTILQRIAEGSSQIDLRFINRARSFDTNGKSESPAVKPGTADDPDDIRSRPMGKILVKWGILTPERVEKALLVQEERKAKGLNVRIGDVMTDMGLISAEQRDKALAAQSGFGSFEAWDVAVAKELMICGGSRIPMMVFLTEDWLECERYGERTLVTYREKARQKLANMEGAACPSGLTTPDKDVLVANIAEWLTHFERVQWMLLTSPRLSAMHGEM